MVMREDPRETLRDPRAREVTEAELDALTLANFEHYGYGRRAVPGIVLELVAAQRAMRAGTETRRFGAGEGGGLQSMCTLYVEPDSSDVRLAMVEQVGTLPDHRERGLAKAVVSAAVAAAGEWEADLITVPADANDWPQLMYSRLGFAPVGVESTFTLRNASAGTAT
jgi:GNAT superfamily N-acetyltransferase